jgi:energy-coupling factor transporter transmembrane protein EcfT
MKDWHCAEVLTLSLGMLLAAQCVSFLPGELIVLSTTTTVVLATRSVRPRRWILMLLTPAGFLLSSLLVAPLAFAPHHDLAHSFYFDSLLLRKAEIATLRSLASVSCTLLLLCARSPVEWTAEMPGGTTWRFFADMLVLMERYFYLLRDSAKSILVAQEARLSRISRRRQVHSFALLCSALLARAEDRADRLQRALDARLYNGELVVRRSSHPLCGWRLAWILLLVASVVLAGRYL